MSGAGDPTQSTPHSQPREFAPLLDADDPSETTKEHHEIVQNPNTRRKKQYTDMLGLIGSLEIFAGGLTIATQFIMQCPGPDFRYFYRLFLRFS
jgi:hypothetical protein